jgi:hypothetical protein
MEPYGAIPHNLNILDYHGVRKLAQGGVKSFRVLGGRNIAFPCQQLGLGLRLDSRLSPCRPRGCALGLLETGRCYHLVNSVLENSTAEWYTFQQSNVLPTTSIISQVVLLEEPCTVFRLVLPIRSLLLRSQYHSLI